MGKEDNNICGIYKITSPTGRIYIGQSYNILGTWQCRYQKKTDKLPCVNQRKLYNSLIKHGWKNHKFEIIESCQKEQLNYYEVYYIWIYDSYNSSHGMNCTHGGDGCKGVVWRDESKKKASDSKKKMYENGYISPLIGIPLKEEHKKNLSKRTKGTRTGKENTFYGKTHTDDALKKIGEKSKGRYFKTIRPHVGLRVAAENNGMFGVRLCGSDNPNYGKKMTKESKKWRSMYVLNTETGVFYRGVKAASATIGISPRALSNRLIGKTINHTNFIYV